MPCWLPFRFGEAIYLQPSWPYTCNQFVVISASSPSSQFAAITGPHFHLQPGGTAKVYASRCRVSFCFEVVLAVKVRNLCIDIVYPRLSTTIGANMGISARPRPHYHFCSLGGTAEVYDLNAVSYFFEVRPMPTCLCHTFNFCSHEGTAKVNVHICRVGCRIVDG